MAQTIFMKFCGFIVRSNLNKMTRLAIHGKSFKLKQIIFSLVSTFSKKNKTYKMGLRVCVSVCVSVCMCVSVYSFGPPLTISIPVKRLI